jgi:ribonuclease T2
MDTTPGCSGSQPKRSPQRHPQKGEQRLRLASSADDTRATLNYSSAKRLDQGQSGGAVYRILFLASLTLAALSANEAHAEVPLKGFLIAREACPALRSIRNQTNPGAVQTVPSRSYRVVAKNRPGASHYLIEIEGAEPSRRWVAVSCGEHVVAVDGSGEVPNRDSSSGERSAYVLAVSWQAAFCEGKPEKAECKTQGPDRFDARHFALHGLWPQPRSNIYCDVSSDLKIADKNGDWDRLPAPNLSVATRQKLVQMMPGTQSNLDRHEWIKHGTCFVDPAEDYFARSIALIEQLNRSKVQELFASSIGSELMGSAVRAAFDESFGEGAGDRVRIACKRDGSRNLIVELTIGLVGEIGDEPSLPELIAASEPTDPGCPRGIVDPVGLQ